MKFIMLMMVLHAMVTVSAESMLNNGNFEREIAPWELSDEKIGALSLVTGKSNFIHSGIGALKLEAGEKGTVRIVCRDNYGYINTSPGQRWKFKAWAKGNGVLKFGVYEYGEPTHTLGLDSLGSTWSPGFNLSENWQCFEYQYIGQRVHLSLLLAAFEVSGSSAVAYIDDVEFLKDSTPGWKMNLLPRNLVSYPGGTLELGTSLLYNQNPAPGETVTVNGSDLGSCGGICEPQTSGDGKINWQFKLPANQPTGVRQLSVICSKAGIGETVYADIIPEAQYRELEEQASTIRNPGTVLVIGDSISDFLRGYNYIDTLAYFTAKRFPGQSVWRNYGIGGDMAPRCIDRLNGKKVHAFKRYAGIFDVKPNLVIISLGHNDSLVLDKTMGINSPLQVPPEKFKENMLELIKIVRQKCNNPEIVLLTPVLADYEKSMKHCAKVKYVFGEPSVVAKYRDLVKEIGQIAGCSVIDVFTPTANHPNRNALYNFDGVHLTSSGNKVIAMEILKYLNSKAQKQ